MLRSARTALRLCPHVRSAAAAAAAGSPCLQQCALPAALLSARLRLAAPIQPQTRYIWGWLNAIFNKVDNDRINMVGPDRACAEWLLRCGAHFRWRSHPEWMTDYNSLGPGGKKMYIEEINADNACIMDIGFEHFKGMSSVRKIRFHYCGYLEDSALSKLHYLSHCLESLEISSCGNVTVDGLRKLAKLTHLRELHLYDLPEIEDRDACVKELQKLMPKCHITFPTAEKPRENVKSSKKHPNANSTEKPVRVKSPEKTAKTKKSP